MNLKSILTLVSLVVLMSVSAQKTNAPKFGKGLFNLVGKDSTFTMKVGLRFQTLTTFNWDASGGLSNSSSNMLIRRSRLKFDGWAFSPKLKYKLELGLSNRDKSGGSYFTHNSSRQIMDAVCPKLQPNRRSPEASDQDLGLSTGP